MKRAIAWICAIGCFILSACGSIGGDTTGGQEIILMVENTVPDRVQGLGATWYKEEEPIGFIGATNADGTDLGRNRVELCISEEDLKDVDLDAFRVGISVTEQDGVSEEVAVLTFQAKLGETYSFQLRYNDGIYSVWQSFED